MEIMCSPLDQETKGIMTVDRLFITDRSMKSCYLEIEGKICPGSQIGWVTSITVCLKYGDSLIGKFEVPDMPMILDDENNFKTDWYETKNPEMIINNMRAFSRFFQDVMPQKDKNSQFEQRLPITADLTASKNGHALTMSIDLRYPARMKTTVTRLIIDGSSISITIEITNGSPLEIFFDNCTLILSQNQHTIGKLSGLLDIMPGSSFEAKFHGKIQHSVSGMAILKGDGYNSCCFEETWKQYAIKLFEAEVNLDKLNVGDANEDDVVDDDDE
ncbi:hypothetical protein LI328DRAFT_160571 [Trichoderma asperelloides]|nr:hypothetical protein LI328DRAFT_160571 [Trichoderma asperelloides]